VRWSNFFKKGTNTLPGDNRNGNSLILRWQLHLEKNDVQHHGPRPSFRVHFGHLVSLTRTLPLNLRLDLHVFFVISLYKIPAKLIAAITFYLKYVVVKLVKNLYIGEYMHCIGGAPGIQRIGET